MKSPAGSYYGLAGLSFDGFGDYRVRKRPSLQAREGFLDLAHLAVIVGFTVFSNRFSMAEIIRRSFRLSNRRIEGGPQWRFVAATPRRAGNL